MEWTIQDGKILADNTPQTQAVFLWTLVPLPDESISIERKLILDFRRMPAITRLSFGPQREAEEIACRRALGQVELIPLVVNRQPVAIPEQYRGEIAKALHTSGAEKLVEFLRL